MSSDEQDFHKDLARLHHELHATAELIHTSDGWWPADDGVDAVHSIVRSAAHALRALAGWYDRSSERLFDNRLGAEQDGTTAVGDAERALRAFAAELETIADRHAGLVVAVDHLRHRDLYAVADDELDELDEHYAVREVSGAPAEQITLAVYDREDVARAEARDHARDGFAGSVYGVIAVSDGVPERTVAVWPGEGDEHE